ncbi:hypothetical protein BS47DRAFT_1340575 [Hydnum rufescens UP504]|uniref:Uncharacterized protein n=1 Tax=Hydnum rufescens UP504 TaxID=1448309 RepID=A0A9P6DZG0_9AGAM|nr:hypothetical protein BS47DRAFT_1340575 [Hydnum rufescens UP504]
MSDSVRALNTLTGYPSDIPQSRIPALSRTGIPTHFSSPTDSANPSHPFLSRKQLEMRHNLHPSKRQREIQRQYIYPVNHVPVSKTIPSGLLVNPAGLGRYPDLTPLSTQLYGSDTMAIAPAIIPIGEGPDIPRAVLGPCSVIAPLPTITTLTRVSLADSAAIGHPTRGTPPPPRTAAEPRQSQSRNQGHPARHRHHATSRTSFPGPLRRSSSLHRGRPRPPPAPKISPPAQLAFRAKGRIVNLVNLECESTTTSPSTSTAPVAKSMIGASSPCESEFRPQPVSLDRTPNNALLISRAVTEHYPTIQYASIPAHHPDRARETWKKLAELGMAPTPVIDSSAPEDSSGDESETTSYSETCQHEPPPIESGGPNEAHYARLRRLWSPRTLGSNRSLVPMHPDIRHVLSVLRSP